MIDGRPIQPGDTLENEAGVLMRIVTEEDYQRMKQVPHLLVFWMIVCMAGGVAAGFCFGIVAGTIWPVR